MNTLEIRDIKTIKVEAIRDTEADLFNWSNREIIITDIKGQEFTLKLYSEFLDKRVQEKEDESAIKPMSKDLHKDLLINFMGDLKI